MTPDKKVEPAPLVPPFVRYVASAIPMVFDNSLSYYECLAALTKYLQDVVDVINNNGAVTEEYIALTKELKEYVENYFANLDVQEEINNKLDAMVADGTLTTLIGNYCDPKLEAQDLKIEAMEETVNAFDSRVTSNSKDYMSRVRKDSYTMFDKVSLPAGFTEDIFSDLELYRSAGGNYKAFIDESKYINSSTNTWYVAPDGNNTNTGADAEHPWLRITTSLQGIMSEGDTVVFKSGIYPRDAGIYSSNAITKSLNLVCNDGVAVFSNYEDTFVWSSYGSHTYYTTRSGCYALYDIRDYANEKFITLTQLNDIDDVDAMPGSWCQSGSSIYVHMIDDTEPNINTLGLNLAVNIARIQLKPTSNAKFYLKNLTILTSNAAGIVAQSNDYDVYCYIKDCNIYNIYRKSDGLQNLGCKTICNNVHMANIRKDGFNYHVDNTKQAYGIEINCKVNACGIGADESDYSNNATTAHDECKAVRINGVYNYCSGGVVIDVNDSLGACYNCLIGDSFMFSRDASVSHNAELYLYDCYLKGSTSEYNLFTASQTSTVYISNCEYETSSGNIVDLNA